MQKLFQGLGASGRHETEPSISPQFPNERWLTGIHQRDDRGRPFWVNYFFDPNGYKRGDKPILCQDCDGDNKEIATIRAEISSIEPQGSEYFGLKHTPQALQEANVLPKTS